MSSLCLSSVLTGANFAMYQSTVSDVVPQQPASINTMNISNAAYISNLSGELLFLTFFPSVCVYVCRFWHATQSGPAYAFHLYLTFEWSEVILFHSAQMFGWRVRVRYAVGAFLWQRHQTFVNHSESRPFLCAVSDQVWTHSKHCLFGDSSQSNRKCSELCFWPHSVTGRIDH